VATIHGLKPIFHAPPPTRARRKRRRCRAQSSPPSAILAYLSTKEPCETENAERIQHPARNQGLQTQDAPIGQIMPNKTSNQKVTPRVGKLDSLVNQATEVSSGPSYGPSSFSKSLDVSTFPGDASPSERIPKSTGTSVVPIPSITQWILKQNDELKENDECGTGNVETLTLLTETRIQILPPDNCGPNTIVIPTELCGSSRNTPPRRIPTRKNQKIRLEALLRDTTPLIEIRPLQV